MARAFLDSGHGPPYRQKGITVQQKVAELPVVVSADEMDDETFLTHFETRHYDQLPGLKGFSDLIWKQPNLIETYRKFHEKIHELIVPGMMEEPHNHE